MFNSVILLAAQCVIQEALIKCGTELKPVRFVFTGLSVCEVVIGSVAGCCVWKAWMNMLGVTIVQKMGIVFC